MISVGVRELKNRLSEYLRMVRRGVERGRRAFPREPIRTLDAVHLSTAPVARGVVSDLQLLSLDARIRANAAELGFDVVPAT